MKPTSRFIFVGLNILLWLTVLLNIFIGSIAAGLVFQGIFGSEWDLILHVTQNPFGGFFLVLPYVWILFLILSLFLAYKIYPHTKKGYRHRPGIILGFILIFSFLLGLIHWSIGITDNVEYFAEKLPPYAKLRQTVQDQWINPDKGIIKGKIIKIEASNLVLENHKSTWGVNIEKALILGDKKPQIHDSVLIIGEKINENNFKALEIRPWRGSGKKIQEIFHRPQKRIEYYNNQKKIQINK